MVKDKMTKKQYRKLKNSYLSKNRTMFSLYQEANREATITKQNFFDLINQIRQEEGLNHFYK